MAADDARPELRSVPVEGYTVTELEALECVEAAELRLVLERLRWSQRNLEAVAARGVKRGGELEFVIDQGRQMIEWAERELARYEADGP